MRPPPPRAQTVGCFPSTTKRPGGDYSFAAAKPKTLEEIEIAQEESLGKREGGAYSFATKPKGNVKTLEEIEIAQEEALGKRDGGTYRFVAKQPNNDKVKTLEEIAQEQEALARRQAVKRSQLEAAALRRTATTGACTHTNHPAAAKGPPRKTKSLDEIAQEQEILARKAAVEKSRLEAEEEKARAYAIERSRLEAEAQRMGKSSPK